jgi:hypothetical protein
MLAISTSSFDSTRTRLSSARTLIPVATVLAAFVIDLRTPNGLIDGLLYVLAILTCAWVPNPKAAWYTSFAIMLPMVLGFLLSPTEVPTWIAMTNRVVAMGIVWAAAWVMYRSMQAGLQRTAALKAMQRRLHSVEGLPDWLDENIGLELGMIDWRLNRFSRGAGRLDIKTEALLLRQAVRRARYSVKTKETQLREVCISVI